MTSRKREFMNNKNIIEALACKEKYDAVKNYCLLSKKNASQNDDEWAEGFKKVQKAQDKVRKLLGSEYVTAIILNRDELIEKFGW
jgi:diadenosine tetraphosphate (Ap4A) HIT family hydrolase